MSGSLPALVLRDVSKWYGPISALMGVSLEVGEEVVGLVGQNGAGKSTLLGLASGLMRPSQGEVLLDGLPVRRLAARSRLGFCPDTEPLYEGLTGRDFLAWMLRYHGLRRRAARLRAAEVLDDLGLGDAMHRPIHTYSKGMRQRVRLGQALAHEPDLVLLDEPMTGLDPVARSELGATIRSLPARGTGVLVSSHVLHELEAIVDRVAFLHQGRLLAQGPLSELRDRLPDQPRRFRIVGERLRELAGRVLALPCVDGVEVSGGSLEVTVHDLGAFLPAMTEVAAGWEPGVTALEPLDEDLAFVFDRYVS